MTIFVIAEDGTKLMPTFNIKKVRHMLKSGSAVICKHNPFTIRLTYKSSKCIQPIEFKDLNIEDHFSKLLKLNLNNQNSDFMNFAKRQATNFYGIQARNLVLDTAEFVQDVLNS